MCGSATTKIRDVILDFDMVSEIITFEKKGRYGREKHQNSSGCRYGKWKHINEIFENWWKYLKC